MELSNLFFFFPCKSKSVLKFGLAETVSSDKPLPNIASPVFHPSTQQNKAHTVWTGSDGSQGEEQVFLTHYGL